MSDCEGGEGDCEGGLCDCEGGWVTVRWIV